MHKAAGRTDEQIHGLLDHVRKQRISQFLYLPSGPAGFEESVVTLDDIQSVPLSSLDGLQEQRIFALNQFGWYLLLIKLSIHFTRMGERLRRIDS